MLQAGASPPGCAMGANCSYTSITLVRDSGADRYDHHSMGDGLSEGNRATGLFLKERFLCCAHPPDVCKSPAP